MIIGKRKAKEMIEGDVLILDYLKLKKSEKVSWRYFDDIEESTAGETFILLFEIDDIDMSYTNGKNRKQGLTYTFYSLEGTEVIFEGGHQMLAYISNPWHTLSHYKAEAKRRSDEILPKLREYYRNTELSHSPQ